MISAILVDLVFVSSRVLVIQHRFFGPSEYGRICTRYNGGEDKCFSRDNCSNICMFDEAYLSRIHDIPVRFFASFIDILFILKTLNCRSGSLGGDESVGLVSCRRLRHFSMNKFTCRYERSANSTLLFFALQETILFTVAISLASLLVYGMYTI